MIGSPLELVLWLLAAYAAAELWIAGMVWMARTLLRNGIRWSVTLQ